MKLGKAKGTVFIAVFALVMMCAGFSSNACAAAYEATSSLSLTLSSVTGDDDWSVFFERYWIDYGAFTSGDGNATHTRPTTARGYMLVGDTVELSTSATGGTNIGIAESYCFWELDLYATNYSSQGRGFSFEYEYLLSSTVSSNNSTDDALSRAALDVLDNFFSIDLLENVTADLINGPLTDQLAFSGSFSFTLLPHEMNWISAQGSSQANAAAVPAPPALMLLSGGLGFLLLIRRRKLF